MPAHTFKFLNWRRLRIQCIVILVVFNCGLATSRRHRNSQNFQHHHHNHINYKDHEEFGSDSQIDIFDNEDRYQDTVNEVMYIDSTDIPLYISDGLISKAGNFYDRSDKSFKMNIAPERLKDENKESVYRSQTNMLSHKIAQKRKDINSVIQQEHKNDNTALDGKYLNTGSWNLYEHPHLNNVAKQRNKQYFTEVPDESIIRREASRQVSWDNSYFNDKPTSSQLETSTTHKKYNTKDHINKETTAEHHKNYQNEKRKKLSNREVPNQKGLYQNEENIIASLLNHSGYHHHTNVMHHRHYHHFEQINDLMDLTNRSFRSLIEAIPVSESEEIPWPVKKEALVEGDLILGGLMMVHEREDTVTCGPVMPQGGIQALETMLYTLDVLNSAPDKIPNVTIGAHILDDCDKDTYGLEMAVDFIKGSISNIDGAEYHCNKTQVRKVISGVVGAASSVTSIQVANLLRLFRIPQVSFFSTSPELSNKQRFEYFSRTIPSDHYQVKAMVEIVRRMGWSYVSIIYEESNYGIKAFEELETLLAKHDICIAVKEKLVKDSGVAEEIAYDSIVHKLLTKPRARGAIIFGSDQEVAGVMRAVRRCNATGSFSWIGSDGWSARSLVSDGNEAEVEGTLSVQPQANPVRGFEEYFLNLTVESNRRNPWFVEFWEDHFHCRYPNSSRTPYNQKYKTECNITERLHRDNTPFEGQLQFVSDAVMAFAHAFRDMHKELCHGRPGLCDAMKPTKGTELLKYLRKVTFNGLSGDKFRFDPNGDGPARYNIIHFKQMSPGKFQWVRVGEYMEGELRLNMSEIQFKLGHPQSPESVCSLPCDMWQAKKYVEGESCCWHCFNCTQYQIRHPKDETQCLTCLEGTVPDESRVFCRQIPEVFLRPESGWAIGAMSLSSTGILITLFVCGVFMRHNDTPVVRASGRELSYVLLTGILLCYSVTFALVLRPTDVVCGIQRFGTGFCFTVVYAAILTKTNRIARIFNAGKRTTKRPSFISPHSQLIICSGFIGVQVLINGVWIMVSPPRAVHHYPTREDNHLVCSSHIDASYMIAFGYPIVLIVVCTLYAVLTRKIPEAFNESKHIGFTMYTTCVIWLAFVPLYFGTGNHVPLRITSMSVTISLSASVTLACLFTPKLYIILVHPERNVRQSIMAGHACSSRSPAVSGAAHSGSMMAAVACSNAQRPPFQPAAPQQSGSSIGLDSGLQSDVVELELREDVVHQSQRKHEPCLLVNRSTQTAELPTNNTNNTMANNTIANNTAATNCTTNHQPVPPPPPPRPSQQQKQEELQQQNQQQQPPLTKLSETCHIINSSSNGPIAVPQTQQKKKVRDVLL